MDNYPNPFNQETRIRFSVEAMSASPVTIDIYNVKGQRIRALVNGMYGAGKHSVVWNGRDDYGVYVSSGVYFYCMTADGYTSVKKNIMMK